MDKLWIVRCSRNVALSLSTECSPFFTGVSRVQSSPVWNDLQESLKKHLGEQIYASWFEPIECESFEKGELVLRVPNKIFEDWIGKHYLELMKKNLSDITGIPAEKLPIRFVTNADMKSRPEEDHSVKTYPEPILNRKYAFENFVVGTSNQFAHAACLAVAESPAKAYNPLFIYGGVGLGKTHLMQAIGWFTLNKYENKLKVVYVSSESFTNELINAIQHRKTSSFRSKYRGVDLLLIDDIHFLGGKESTQEEFFHTFNALYDAHKQIVVSSDCPPKEIRNLEKRLVSRFDWGLITDIQPPDLETRIAILRKKSSTQNFNIPEEIILFIASKIKFNIRELEGALTRVVAFSSLNKEPLSLEMAQQVMSDLLPKEKQITLDLIQTKVADYFNLHILDMKKKNRSKTIALPRQIAMYLARELTDHSFPEIGDNFGGRDHTTILHGCRKIEAGLQTDDSLRKIVDELTQIIKE